MSRRVFSAPQLHLREWPSLVCDRGSRILHRVHLTGVSGAPGWGWPGLGTGTLWRVGQGTDVGPPTPPNINMAARTPRMLPPAVFTIDNRHQRIVDLSPIGLLQRHRSRARPLLGPCWTLTYRHARDSDEPAVPIASEMASCDRNRHPMQRALSYLIARPADTPYNPR